MDHQFPLISVIIAVRNASGTLERCLDSVRQQRFANFEVIVKDGGSTDGTVEIIRRHADTGGAIRWVSGADRGVYDAWNQAIAMANGEWLHFLGADDVFFDPDALTRIAPHLQTSDGRHIVYAPVEFVDGSGRRAVTAEPWPTARRKLWLGTPMPHQGVFQHRDLVRQHGAFDSSFAIVGDYEWLLRELKTGRDPVFVDVAPIVRMQAGGLSTRPENRIRGLREFRRAQRMHGKRWPSAAWSRLYGICLAHRVVVSVIGQPALDRLRGRKTVDQR